MYRYYNIGLAKYQLLIWQNFHWQSVFFEIVLIIAQALANGLILLMHCLVVTIFVVLIIILQVLLLFCCCQLWFTMNFIISYKQYIGKTVYGIGY